MEVVLTVVKKYELILQLTSFRKCPNLLQLQFQKFQGIFPRNLKTVIQTQRSFF